MVVLPPGTLLQLMYLKERLQRTKPEKFIEIGPGAGEITAQLLKAGWTGAVYDIAPETIERLKRRFVSEIASGQLMTFNRDFISDESIPFTPQLVISCMVMEHFPDEVESAYLRKAALLVGRQGKVIGLVPGSPEHWGIEDDIAGHCRRYTRRSITQHLNEAGFELTHISGLTFPVSNMLLPVSNFLVKRSEAGKLGLSEIEKTKQSGQRNVRFKTSFPAFLRLLLNEVTMLPFHWMQKQFGNSAKCLVIYFEAATTSK